MNIVYKSVNWMQGMSVSSSHFIATENYLMERLMKNTEALQNKFAYGMLPMSTYDDKEDQMALYVEGKGTGTRLVLGMYHGITRGGCLVDVEPIQPVICECSSEIDTAEQGWDVVLSVSPFERRPCGEPDMQETPPRYPFVDPVYKLSIIERDKETVNEYGPFDVVVGLLKKKDGELMIDNSYIAPSLSMSSTYKLRRGFETISNSMGTIKNALSVIFNKAYASVANKSECMENTLKVCRELQRAISNMEYKWRSYGLSLSPYQVTELFGEIANAIMASFLFMSKSGKDEMLKYFYEWNGIAPSAFEEILDNVASKEFCQNRIETSMSSIDAMLNVLEGLLVSLSKLDYVGQRKESMVISVTSAKDTSDQSKKSSWLL
ncbi:MAG: hypothetical protein K6E14_08975 [Paludibacteraceae bacterium]|nr:hypothetical protein [Paludibacteraceae bacterium]